MNSFSVLPSVMSIIGVFFDFKDKPDQELTKELKKKFLDLDVNQFDGDFLIYDDEKKFYLYDKEKQYVDEREQYQEKYEKLKKDFQKIKKI